MKVDVIEFKCRRCGVVYIERTVLEHKGTREVYAILSQKIPQTDHACEDGGHGIADPVGWKTIEK